jgi:tRNA(Ile)-lysidine synthase
VRPVRAGAGPDLAAVRVAVRRTLADLPSGTTVLVAVSGGADSLALADATRFEVRRAARSRRLRAGGITVDHGLQPGSAARARGVAAALAAAGLEPVEVVHVAVTGTGGPEAAARDARCSALAAAALRHGPAVVLLGHTRDDQAESVLLGLARGSGARSLAGMPAARDPFRRPLLGLARATVRGAAAAGPFAGDVWHDPHNDDQRYARARVRGEALPTLERTLGPGVAAALARTADLLREDADALDAWATAELAAARRDPPPGGAPSGTGHQEGSTPIALDAAALARLPAAVRRRALRQALIAAGCPAGALTRDHVVTAAALVERWAGQGAASLPGGVQVTRRGGLLHLRRGPAGG